MSIEKQDEIIRQLERLNDAVCKQNENIYKVLILTIGGAFALVGIKLVIP